MSMAENNGRYRFPYVLFDMGGTLLYFDTAFDNVLEDMFRAAAQALRGIGYALDEKAFADAHRALDLSYYQRRDEEMVEYTSEYVLREILRQYSYPAPRPEDLQQAIKAMYSISQAHWQVEDDAVPMLEALRAHGCQMGIVSNASDDCDVQTLVDNAQLRPYFDFILTSAKSGFRKPNPRIFQQSLAYWSARPEQAIMVGDTVSADVAGANRMGIASVWITRRANRRENAAAVQQHHPSVTIAMLSELPELLANWPHSTSQK